MDCSVIKQGKVDMARTGGKAKFAVWPNGNNSKTIVRFEGGQFSLTQGFFGDGLNLEIVGFWELCDLRDVLTAIIEKHDLDGQVINRSKTKKPKPKK